VFDRPAYGLVVTFTGDSTLWAPFQVDSGSLVALAGRAVFDESEWQTTNRDDGSGGLAASIVHGHYEEVLARAFARLNGNCVAIVHDAPRQRLHLATDRCGVFPAFEVATQEGWLYGSHPDVLAAAAEVSHRVDETSLAEFILSGTVTPPFSYYEGLRAVDHGSVVTFDLASGQPGQITKHRYFDFVYRGDSRVPEVDLATQLADALRRAVQRRTLSRLGPTAVALSGGLDSRVVLASRKDKDQSFAFSCYDEPNRELATAEAIARGLSVRFLALQRGRDYYAENAEDGVRISGAMGSFANNHFLGVIPLLRREGMETLLTGCYCDYLFKGLPLNRRNHWLTRRESLGAFRHQFYFDYFSADTALADRARERWENRIPPKLRTQDTVERVFQIEARRTFPLCYEGDNQQRLVPQRLTGWCPPFVDRDVIDVYCRLPYQYKLNRSVFRRVVTRLTPGLGVPDANTGVAPGSSIAREWLASAHLRLGREWRRVQGSASTDESWPDWRHYVAGSPTLDRLWKRPNEDAMALFSRILGSTVTRDADDIKRQRPFLFVNLLTAKLWLDRRTW
jgi:asparagine synthase (glutamine-hydrolysing)